MCQMIYTVKALPHLSGQATWVFCVNRFSSKQENFCETVLCKFCVYLLSQMRDSCTSVASVLRGMPATPAHGTWNLRIRYGQHTCTARYGRVNSVVNARELWIYKNERFSPILWNHLSVLINQNDFQILQKTLLSEIIFRYWKLLSNIGNYFPKSWNTGQIPLTSPTPFTDIV